MKLLAEIPYEDVDFVYVTDHWDIHVEGLCLFTGALCLFRGLVGVEAETLSIYSLGRIEKARLLMGKYLFEFFIGTHWTYPLKPYKRRAPTFFWALMFRFYYKVLSR